MTQWLYIASTLTETLIILDISQKPNLIIVLVYIERISSRFDIKCFQSCAKSFSSSGSLSFFSFTEQTAPLPPSSTFLYLWVLIFNYFFDVLLGQRRKPGSHVFASSLMVSNTKRTNLTWLPLEIMHRGHTWHDYPWPWVSLTWLLCNLQLDDVPGADFENSL